MKASLAHLPWTRESVPHGVLDINRGCNIRCRDCYNTLPQSCKSLAEVEAELGILLHRRKLHSVSLVGGEVTLHPQLCEIVRLIARRGLHVEVFTNGVKLDGALLARLKEAGATVVFLHIERGQQRPDLSPNATAADLHRLRTEKVALAASHGLDVGLSLTAYPNEEADIVDAVRFTVESPHVNHLLVTLWRDVRRIRSVEGDVDMGLCGELEPSAATAGDTLTNPMIAELLEREFGFKPFGVLGSNISTEDPRWLSYLIGAVYGARENQVQCAIWPSRFEPAFLWLYHALAGRYPFYQGQNTARFRLHLLFNGILGGELGDNLRLLVRSFTEGAVLTHKRLLFQCLATVDETGRVVHCSNCPDAVVKDGRLVPLCISDRVISRSTKRL